MNDAPRKTWDALAAHGPAVELFPGWDSRAVRSFIERGARHLVEVEGLRSGEACALRIGNRSAHVLALLAALHAGARVVLFGADEPEAELERVARALGGARELRLQAEEPEPALTLTGTAPSEASDAGAAILLRTSGSTGEPALVERSERSLLLEAERYRRELDLGPADRIALPLPVFHAYALGWLMASLVSGARSLLLEPRALGGLQRALERDATIVALTPSLARLLARRPRAARGGAELRLVMVGAGPVDAALEADFRERFGVGLARNYGSTETGATLAGPASLPPGCAGRPMTGVRTRITDEEGRPCGPGVVGSLEVRFDGEEWWSTGDLARVDEEGRTWIEGRRTSSARRGDAWVSPLEVESVLRTCPALRQLSVLAAPGDRAGYDHLVAHVVPVDPASFRAADLIAYARERLALSKIPDRIEVHARLPRSPAGKPLGAPRYRAQGECAPSRAEDGIDSAELHGALEELGVLTLLDGERETAEVARTCGLSGDRLDLLLQIAQGLGLVTRPGVPPLVRADRSDEPASFPAALTRAALTSFARTPAAARAPELHPAGEALRAHRDGGRVRERVARALDAIELPAQGRFVELTNGPGVYLRALLADGGAAQAHLVQRGAILAAPLDELVEAADAGRLTISESMPAEACELLVVCDAVHALGAEPELEQLLQLVAPGGALLFDDLFAGAGQLRPWMASHWIAAGDARWREARDLEEALFGLGADVRTLPAGGEPARHLILATPRRGEA